MSRPEATKDYDASGKTSTRSLTRGEVKMALGQLARQDDEVRRKSGARVMGRKTRMEYRRSLLSELLDTDRQIKHIVDGVASEKKTDESNEEAPYPKYRQ